MLNSDGCGGITKLVPTHNDNEYKGAPSNFMCKLLWIWLREYQILCRRVPENWCKLLDDNGEDGVSWDGNEEEYQEGVVVIFKAVTNIYFLIKYFNEYY